MISIVAPAYNEEAVIKDFVEQVVDVTRFFFECGNWEVNYPHLHFVKKWGLLVS